MAPMPSLRQIFSIPYRGGSKNWSMRYHFTGGVPADNAAWAALDVAIFNELKNGLRSDIEIVESRGYANDTSPAVFSATHGSPGLISPSAGDPQGAYQACLLSWTTDQRNSRGGPIFLHNFVHGVVARSTDFDELISDQHAALQTFSTRWSDSGAGYSDGTVVHKRAGPNGAAGLVGDCREFSSHRVLARRG